MTHISKNITEGNRTLLVLNLTNKDHFCDKPLSDNQWHIMHANSLECAFKLLQEHACYVAIALISTASVIKVTHAIERLQSQFEQLLWVALCTDDKCITNRLTFCLTDFFIDYHHFPIDWEKLQHTLGHAYGVAIMNTRHQHCTADKSLNLLLGDSAAICNLKAQITKIAAADEPILLSGETGTGKGLCANLIHNLSRRHLGPFVVVNCGALPASLIHSELFGHEKGAFTGADKQYIGRIERANSGTLFLDEIGDLSLDLQINLLHFLEDHYIERLGGNKKIDIDCRIIFASHINLETAVDEGRFREDLYYRINILHIEIPSLRDHCEDINLLSNAYLQKFSPPRTHYCLTNKARQVMEQYEWPGNVRELKNRIHRAVIMASSEHLSEIDLGLTSSKCPTTNQDVIDLAQHRTDIDTELLLDAIKRNNHNISAAARELNISRTTFYRLIKKCKIKL
ncbi:sigma-54 dependent transcriptional regulator [Shewanella algidipiscicola]|uniref:Sigma-54-dependent Fis family transcriptional regulator n=1 Tax=Shewanella algidipiscicola TaxID=614070 RepID=A0ABQ4PGF9_9GAMM|nr:sigma-54 dependent transcriptional regulator [Shewanella algidipiscicola]GIU46647.1 sigma-54-dependent Fis family transcriptional regulator [Shewanella algidipiscicola]